MVGLTWRRNLNAMPVYLVFGQWTEMMMMDPVGLGCVAPFCCHPIPAELRGFILGKDGLVILCCHQWSQR
jgi:hypothetical protein